MLNDKELYQAFKSNKSEIRDDGFTKRVMKELPEQNNILPRIIVLLSIVLGTIITVIVLGSIPFFDQVGSMVTSISQLQVPSSSSVTTYITGIVLLSSIGFAMSQPDIK